jgi:hypothetical protein
VFYTSETPTLTEVSFATLSTIYRCLYQRHYGLPTTLEAALVQEGLAARFAGAGPKTVRADAAKILSERLGETRFTVLFTCLWGDKVAKEFGHDPLGLPDRAGLDYARAFTLELGLDPVEILGRRGERAVKQTKVATPMSDRAHHPNRNEPEVPRRPAGSKRWPPN